jgi:hypothetical protein
MFNLTTTRSKTRERDGGVDGGVVGDGDGDGDGAGARYVVVVMVMASFSSSSCFDGVEVLVEI